MTWFVAVLVFLRSVQFDFCEVRVIKAQEKLNYAIVLLILMHVAKLNSVNISLCCVTNWLYHLYSSTIWLPKQYKGTVVPSEAAKLRYSFGNTN